MKSDLLEGYKHAAKTALDVQDACNSGAIVRSFARAVTEVLQPMSHESGLGTDWINTHPIVIAYLDKLASLARIQGNDSAVLSAFTKCEEIVAGQFAFQKEE